MRIRALALPLSFCRDLFKMSSPPLSRSVADFKFSPFKLLQLPVEENRDNMIRRNIPGVVFSRVRPTPLRAPRLVSAADVVLEDILDMDPSVANTPEFVDWIAGNLVLESSTPIAHRYGGHQFGVWAMQLGDGRAILLGEYVNRKGERWELQLKGAGLTPFSRGADGRAVLRSSIREYLCSEALHFLGIPTSRAGAIIVSEDHIVRDLLYDGNPRLEPCAIVLRLAPSWFRIGSFEILASTQETDLLKQLLDFVIKEHFPDALNEPDPTIGFLKRVYHLNADLVVAWQVVGFTHGVLNSDNISILGLTIDYGPFGFLEAYDPVYTPNHSDSDSRYCYTNQPQVMMFNLLMLTRAIAPLLNDEQMKTAAKLLQEEAKYIETKIQETFSKKLYLQNHSPDLILLLFKILEETKADMTMAFRGLSETGFAQMANPSSELWSLKQMSKHKDYAKFVKSYSELMKKQGTSDEERMKEMVKLNPRYILRNWMAEDAIRLADDGDYSLVNLLLKTLRSPYTVQPEAEIKGYAAKPPPWSKTLCLSCSS